jgi:hypothetical protein
VVAKVGLDDQVYAQPLIVPNQLITGGRTPGRYEVVYVVTQGNTVYAINAATGTILLSRTLGAPVQRPPFCGSAGGPSHAGIFGTPVINAAKQTLYVVARLLIGSVPTLQLFALNLGDLTDKIPPATVAASHKLSDGTILNFDATYHKSRPGLVESRGVIYAAFGSICEQAAAHARGWLLGWHNTDLSPLPANTLTNTLVTGTFFMSGIWMSGYGVAATGGNLFFSTGNSAPNTYDGVRNIQESVVKVGPQLVSRLSIFTPSTVTTLDKGDQDLSSGGVLLLPDQPGPFPFLAAATGKSGFMYLLNRVNLGGFTPGGPDNVLDTKFIGKCWCGPSYFTGADNVGRVVSSGGKQIIVWKVQTSPKVAFVQEGVGMLPVSGQDPGTFTTVSSNGTNAGTAIIWATGRPISATNPAVQLYAFAATPSSGQLTLQYSSLAGQWPDASRNANIVPVVANGRVYVASNQQLTIFGLGGHPFVALASPSVEPSRDVDEPPHQITGVLENVEGPMLTLRTRDDKKVQVDDSEPLRLNQTDVLVRGSAYTVQGSYGAASGALRVQVIGRAKDSPEAWPPDR